MAGGTRVPAPVCVAKYNVVLRSVQADSEYTMGYRRRVYAYVIRRHVSVRCIRKGNGKYGMAKGRTAVRMVRMYDS